MSRQHPPTAYRAAVQLARALVPLGAISSAKLRKGHNARGRTLGRIEEWARTHRDPSVPLAWFHAPSVGEGRQAQAVLNRLRQQESGWQYGFTFYSPSAEGLANSLDADVSGYLPYDTPAAAARMLDALQPAALVFAKLDVWPELTLAAARRGIPVLLVAGTVRSGSGRLGWLGRKMIGGAYEALTRVGAVGAEDLERLCALGVAASRIEITGDPRYDSVLDLAAGWSSEEALAPEVRRLRGRAPLMVAGSTWPGDERVLLDAFARLHVHRPGARLILVPHEPEDRRLSGIEAIAARLGLPRPVRIANADATTPLVLVDRTGILAQLYSIAAMAYVGGGFHRAGLHSVIEPAAWGIPVVFGPRWPESRDAALLLTAGGAEAISELGVTEAGESLQEVWEDWIRDDIRRSAQGRKAKGVVLAQTGAAARSAALILKAVGATAAH